MRWSRISRPRLCPWLERLWCRADDLPAGRRNPEDRQAALIGPLRTESKHAIDPGKAGRIGQHLFAEPLRSLRFHKCSDKGDSVISERCGANRILSVTGAIPSGEIAKAR